MKNCFYAADILLPKFSKDPEAMKRWSCVACDQYTSEPEYWNAVEAVVGDAPSTLKITLPELYLSEAEKRIPGINKTMLDYADGVFCEYKSAMIYLERTQSNGRVRRGQAGASGEPAHRRLRAAGSPDRVREGRALAYTDKL